MPQFTCAIEGCEATKHEAKGLCRLHYKRTQTRTPDKPKLEQCIVCGTAVYRHTGGGRKYGRTCSEECRRQITFGWSEPLPDMHWARMYGATCTLTIGECAWCGHAFTSQYSNSTYCSDKCSRRRSSAARRARENNATGRYTWADITRLWRLFDRQCAYCRQATPLHEIQAEHVTPLSRGGANNLSNLLPSCGPCNSDKSDNTLDEWSAERRRLNKPARVTSIDHLDARYAHLALSPASPRAWRMDFAA